MFWNLKKKKKSKFIEGQISSYFVRTAQIMLSSEYDSYINELTIPRRPLAFEFGHWPI